MSHNNSYLKRSKCQFHVESPKRHNQYSDDYIKISAQEKKCRKFYQINSVCSVTEDCVGGASVYKFWTAIYDNSVLFSYTTSAGGLGGGGGGVLVILGS